MTDLIDFESNLRQLKDFQQRVLLVPAQWRAFVPAEPLAWDRVRFTPENKAGVPAQRGIYAFVVQFQDDREAPLALPTHGYVMYAGITGEKAEDRTLFDRYGDYVRDQRRPKRMSIWSMLNKWKDDMFFHFAPVSPNFDLGAAETALNDAIIPPYVTNDFSAEVRQLVRVLRAN
ncbi:hypothetical protein [Sphingomonas faeni]|uniref:hypothetical protein n=1 Tax=Sphingomonas faeni TaxID=185950 RepID=UPI003356421D